MANADVDVTIFSNHFSRSASRLKHKVKELSSKDIIKKATSWTPGPTFARFYNKLVHRNFENFILAFDKQKDEIAWELIFIISSVQIAIYWTCLEIRQILINPFSDIFLSLLYLL